MKVNAASGSDDVFSTFSPRCSFRSSTRRHRTSMGSLRRQEPMMSSRYSNMPSSCSVCPLGFIMAICSTSPWQRHETRWVCRTSHLHTGLIRPEQSLYHLLKILLQKHTNMEPCKKKKNRFPFNHAQTIIALQLTIKHLDQGFTKSTFVSVKGHCKTCITNKHYI